MYDVSKETFHDGDEKQDAVVRQLEIIGEASRCISDSFKEQHPEIPWRAIVGMRNRIVHDYLNVDISVVWEVVSGDLPTLKQKIEAALAGR